MNVSDIKAKIKDSGKIRKILKSLGADFRGLDHQTDTYFRVSHGRLKLREGDIENFLIYYDREDDSDSARSYESILFEVDSNSFSIIKKILVKSLGVLVIVEKKREIYFIDNVKFHIDNVPGLGFFVEIEAINLERNYSVRKLNRQVEYYMNLFGISNSDLVKYSYSDMILKKRCSK